MNQDTVFVLGSVFDQGSFVLRSYDGGAVWDSTWFEGYDFTGIDFPSVLDGYISSFRNSRVSILKTTDGGDNWFVSEDSIVLAQSIPCDIEFYDVNTGVVSLPAWSAITTDGGDEWNEIENHPVGGQRDINIGDDLYIGMSGTLITYSLDYCESFETVVLPYSGSHSSMDAREEILISTAIGSGGLALGFPDNSFGILTKTMFPFDTQSILYLPFVSRFYDVSIVPNDFSIIHGVLLEDNGTLKFVKSLDGGNNWNYLTHEMFSFTNSAQIECANDSICFAISNLPGEIYKTTNGGGAIGAAVDQISLGLNDLNKFDTVFNLFPNPSSTHITLQCEEQIERIEILDVSGRMVLNERVFPQNGVVDISAFPAGVYLVKVATKDGFGVRKLVVE